MTKNLSDFGHMDRDAVSLHIEDIAGELVTIESVEILSGNHGDFAVMQVITESGEIVSVMSGAKFVMDALKDALVQDAFPVEVTFTKRGRSWIF